MPIGNNEFASVNAKLKQAAHHFDSIKNEVATVLKPELYSVTKKISPDETVHSWIFNAPHGIDVERLSLLFSDCIHNLRCSLDHVVYAIAIYESGEDPPTDANKLAFPLACNARQFHDAKGRIKSLSAPVRAAIEAVQPYNRPHPEFPPLLGLLADMNDSDKHRLLKPGIGAFHKTSFGHKIPEGVEFQIRINLKPLEDGAEITSFIFDTPMPKDVTGSFDGEFMIVMPHAPGPKGSKGTEIMTLAHVLTKEVRDAMSVVIRAVK